MIYTIQNIASLIKGEASITNDVQIEYLLFDSRKIYSPQSSLFFAIVGNRRDGHQFIQEVYKKGVRSFVISKEVEVNKFPEANFIKVDDSLQALQTLAIEHRKRFAIPVIGITGSNGKTIVKEWLYQLLHQDHNIVRSPKSFNSQIGVPLSVWQMNEQHTLGIFEAGISKPGEMDKLEKIIQPTIGVLTNIGEAHSEGFSSLAQKEKEKRLLFRNATIPESVVVSGIKKEQRSTTISAIYKTFGIAITIPFSDEASIQNAITCLQVMLHLGYDNKVIAERMKLLTPVNMRLELKKGINNCSIVNDSYSADTSSLEIALNFLDQQSADENKTVILSDFLQSSMPDKFLYAQIFKSLQHHGVKRLIGIGENISSFFQAGNKGEDMEIQLFPATNVFLDQFLTSQFKEEVILVKGARVFGFEQIVQLLEQKAHQTALEINLNAIVRNLKVYQQCLKPETKIMAMVKAFAYGSGGAEIAGILQYHKVDYLGVAYADEGVELRKAGIMLPIMVMNPEEYAFETIVEHNLQPELYSFEILQSFDNFLQQEGIMHYPVHLEIETGMNRLGFSDDDIEKLSERLIETSSFTVQTVFTHFAASEEALQDEFTQKQFLIFNQAIKKLKKKLGNPFLSHIANSAAVVRHPEMQMDMVRLGIGLYGVDSTGNSQLNLQTVTTLKSTVAQIKYLKKGESLSYNRKAIVERDSVIATIRIGYADGYPRRLGNGIGKVWVNGKLASIIGTICMDMFMIDITDIENIKEGDDVILFGSQLPVQQVAKWANTIPYEIMTGISQRVKRVYFEE